MSQSGEKDPTENAEQSKVLYSRADNHATELTAENMATGKESFTSGSDSAAVTVEDVDKFNYDMAFDWLEEHDVDPGDIQNLPELKKLIKSHITKAKSQEDLSKVGKDVAVIPASATRGVMSFCKIHVLLSLDMFQMSRIVRKPDFCLCKNKGTDQLRSNCEADQRLCFRHSDSTIPLVLKSEISSC